MNEKTNPTRRSVLITGASTGIGEACAYHLAHKGWHVYAGVRKQADFTRLEQAGLENLQPLILDVVKPEQVQQAFEHIQARNAEHPFYGLVNNAGVAMGGPLEAVPIEELREQFEINVFAQISVTRQFLPLLRAARGRIINMSSISGLIAMPLFGPYAASKHALEAFSDSLRLELKPWGISVCLIEPGAIVTPIWEKSLQAADERSRRYQPDLLALYKEAMERSRRYTQKNGERGQPVSKVAEAVEHALSAPRPKIRYGIGLSALFVVLMEHWLPDRLRDWLILQQLGKQ